MKKKNWIVLLLLVSGIGGNGVLAQRQTFVTDELENEIEVLMKENNVPAVGIGVIENGALCYVNVYGELNNNTPAPDNAFFNVASLTKPIVMMLTLTLVSNGDWDLDEPLANYWIDPDVKDDPFHKKLTTRLVLTHQTGFDNWRWNNETQKLRFNFEPGTDCSYSGEGFQYLRRALENKFDRTLTELTCSLVFKAFNMNETSFLWDEKTHRSRYAEEHNKEGKPYNLKKRTEKASAADDIITTIHDYGIFAVSVMKAKNLSEKVYNDMIRPQVSVKENVAYGLCWYIKLNFCDNEYALTHTGGDAGVATMVVLMPESKRGIIIFVNGDNGFEIINPIIDKFRGLAE